MNLQNNYIECSDITSIKDGFAEVSKNSAGYRPKNNFIELSK